MIAVPMRTWLKSLRKLNDAHLSIMALSYDLDGAITAKQFGLAWWAQERILLESVRIYALEAGLDIVGTDSLDESFRTLDRFAAVNPSLVEKIWSLWMRSLPEPETFEAAIEETFTFVRKELGLPWALDRKSAVLRWAESTKVLRTVAQNLGIAQTDDWYISSEGVADRDWYEDVLRALENRSS